MAHLQLLHVTLDGRFLRLLLRLLLLLLLARVRSHLWRDDKRLQREVVRHQSRAKTRPWVGSDRK